jgi:predicted ATPase
MGEPPSGTVTFLFTDIEGSTRRWEQDRHGMGLALAAHDEVLRSAVEANGGYLFKHTGDGICAAFSSADAAVAAAVGAQLGLELPVRMGLATGGAELRDGDYFGPVLNRTARVMAAGHGGQVLLSGSTAGVVEGVDLTDLGVHRLRDLSGREHLFQVLASGLQSSFPALRTLDVVPGNLPVQTTSFIGRQTEVKQVAELVRAHRLVTLSGVGGVGKTRLALQAAAGLAGEFPDGVWLVELASVRDAGAVPDAAATALGIVPQAGLSIIGGVVRTLAGQTALVVLDNCEHVLDAAAELVEAVLSGSAAVKVLATSREGLRVAGEHVWPVPPLAADEVGSEAVELFVARAGEVNPGFGLDDDADRRAVSMICQRLDGIALAIELAAARMVSLTPEDVLDRLDNRFGLLSGGRRGQQRHQTLGQAVAWSYQLLDEAERMVLARCSVFAGGFDLAAASQLGGLGDGLAAVNVLDALVRKSMVTVQRVGSHNRYAMLETIRQYAAEQLAASTIEGVREAHARYFADLAEINWRRWDGPEQPRVLDWASNELPNLRAGFRWATDHGRFETATAIAAHTAMITWPLQLFEPVGWAEELLDPAEAAGVGHLPRLYTAAALCCFVGRADRGTIYARKAVALESDPRFDGFAPEWRRFVAAAAALHATEGGLEEALAIVAGQPSVLDRVMELAELPNAGRSGQAREIAEATMIALRERGNPMFYVFGLAGCGRAFTDTDPQRALAAFREALDYSRQHRVLILEHATAYSVAGLEAEQGEPDRALALLDDALEAFHRGGVDTYRAVTLGHLAVLLARIDQPEAAATIYGTSSDIPSIGIVRHLPQVLQELRVRLGQAGFDQRVAAGAAMDHGDAIAYARQQIRLARQTTQQI